MKFIGFLLTIIIATGLYINMPEYLQPYSNYIILLLAVLATNFIFASDSADG